MRIYIGNEEVVCNNNLQIKEKMLSTSSTVLKNCYPLSWETTKDYTQWWFPEDYSKCKIIDDNPVEFEIIGNTTQDGTPTPDNPIPIISKTGTITETISGKSYTFDLGEIELNKIGNYEDKIYKDNGKWYLEKQIGKVTLDGTENWSGSITHRFYISQASLGLNTTTGLCDKFEVKALTSSNSMTFYASNIYIYYDQISGVNNFKTWLSDNNVTLCGVLATPTTTEITDENLLNQLNSVGDDLIFCGVAKNTGNISLNPRQFHGMDLQILDFKDFLSTGETLNYVITNKTITQAIEQVIGSISDYGFVVGNIQVLHPEEIINAYSTLNKTAYDVFQYIAEVTQSRWFTRMVDENTVAIDFYDPSLMTSGLDIYSTQSFYETYDIRDMTYNYSTKDYRNKQIMTSDEVIANITQNETIVADGYSTTFTCQNRIGYATKITLNSVEKTIITKQQAEYGMTGEFIYEPGNSSLFTNTTIPAGGIIVITYYPIVKGREIILDTNESNRISNLIGRKGTISRYENRNDTQTSQELQKIGQSYIKYKGTAEITLKIVSGQNLWNIGEIVHYNAPIVNLTKDYMVKSKTIDWNITSDNTSYTYELTSNFNCEDAVNYFDNQRAKSQGNIGEGEYITRNIDLENEALIIFYDTSMEEVQPGELTELDFELDGVL